MSSRELQIQSLLRGTGTLALGLVVLCVSLEASALPSFARQTGQNCVACHAGGQFPELTPYGRIFKMTGYTIGERTVPLSVMGVASYSNVANTSKSDDPSSDFQKHKEFIPLATGSLFVAGKITDNIGAFAQMTYDNYAVAGSDGSFQGHTAADNMDFRYANRLIDNKRDVIFGLSVNNNPSLVDPWNTAAAWMQYVPVPSLSSYQFIDGTSPFPKFGAGGNISGINAYLFLNKSFYAEVGTYSTARGPLSFMSTGIADADKTKLDGSTNPYWRFALSHEWGAHNAMIGTSGMIAHVYDAGADTSDPNNLGLFRNVGVDAQYQYILDPHTVTVQMAYMQMEQTYSANALAGATAASTYVLADGVTPVAPANPYDITNIFRVKVTYTYQAKYGGGIAYFDKSGTTNSLNQTSGFDPTCGGVVCSDSSTRVTGNLTGSPATRGMTYEAFWMPWQNIRLGAQYTTYALFNGASNNYDGFGRNASDNNSFFLYAWYAF